MLRPAVRAFGSRVEAEAVALRVDLPEELPPVEVDAQRVGQVLRNLLENALTHTPPGGRIEPSGFWREPRTTTADC